MTPSPVKLPTVPPMCCTTTAARLTRSAMISRSRSGPTVAAMSIEWTTSANSTVTCLYSADWAACLRGVPHSLQNLEVGGSSAPHDPQDTPAAVSAPRSSRVFSTSVSFHCWSTMSVISPCHLRDEVSRPHMSLSRWPSALLGPHGRSGDRRLDLLPSARHPAPLVAGPERLQR